MASKRLHALRTKTLIILQAVIIIVIVACSKNGSRDVVSTSKKKSEYQKYFLTEVATQKMKEVIDLTQLNNIEFIIGESENEIVSGSDIYSYDEKNNAYVISAKLKDYFVRRKSLYSYHVKNKLCGYDNDIVAPNKRVPIYYYNNRYYSLFINPDTGKYSIVESGELITWTETFIRGEVPILLFWRDNELFALSGTYVYRIKDTKVIQELKDPILTRYDRTLFYVYSLDDHLVLHFQRTYEDGLGDVFMTINLNDFTYKMKPSQNSIKIGPYNYKAINRTDGWKIYYIGRDPADGIKVLDPLAPDGPKIIESLPGINVAPEGTELP